MKKYLLLILCLVFCFVYVYFNWDAYSKLQFDLFLFSISLIGLTIMFYGRASVFCTQIRVFSENKSYSFFQALHDVSITTFLNSFLPGSLGSLYLIKKIQSEIPNGFLKAANIQIFIFLLQMFLSIGLLVGSYYALNQSKEVVLYFLVIWLVFMVVGALSSSKLMRLKIFSQKHINLVLTTVSEGMTHRRFWPLLFWSSIELIGLIIATQFVLASIGHSGSFLQSAYLTGLSNCSLVLAITPAGLGTSEAIIGAGGTLVSLPSHIGVLLSLLMRLLIIVMSTLFIGLSQFIRQPVPEKS